MTSFVRIAAGRYDIVDGTAVRIGCIDRRNSHRWTVRVFATPGDAGTSAEYATFRTLYDATAADIIPTGGFAGPAAVDADAVPDGITVRVYEDGYGTATVLRSAGSRGSAVTMRRDGRWYVVSVAGCIIGQSIEAAAALRVALDSIATGDAVRARLDREAAAIAAAALDIVRDAEAAAAAEPSTAGDDAEPIGDAAAAAVLVPSTADTAAVLWHNRHAGYAVDTRTGDAWTGAENAPAVPWWLSVPAVYDDATAVPLIASFLDRVPANVDAAGWRITVCDGRYVWLSAIAEPSTGDAEPIGDAVQAAESVAGSAAGSGAWYRPAGPGAFLDWTGPAAGARAEDGTGSAAGAPGIRSWCDVDAGRTAEPVQDRPRVRWTDTGPAAEPAPGIADRLGSALVSPVRSALRFLGTAGAGIIAAALVLFVAFVLVSGVDASTDAEPVPSTAGHCAGLGSRAEYVQLTYGCDDDGRGSALDRDTGNACTALAWYVADAERLPVAEHVATVRALGCVHFEDGSWTPAEPVHAGDAVQD